MLVVDGGYGPTVIRIGGSVTTVFSEQQHEREQPCQEYPEPSFDMVGEGRDEDQL